MLNTELEALLSRISINLEHYSFFTFVQNFIFLGILHTPLPFEGKVSAFLLQYLSLEIPCNLPLHSVITMS